MFSRNLDHFTVKENLNVFFFSLSLEEVSNFKTDLGDSVVKLNSNGCGSF